MKVLVTGANGFLGAHLCHKLIQEQMQVCGLIRNTSDLSDLKKNNEMQFLRGDVTDQESLDRALAELKPEIIFHLAGYVGYKKSERDLMEKVNVQGTQNLLDSMIKNNIRKIIHVSSVVAVGAGFTKDASEKVK
jgi:dihydroflavonol-4-reductase